MVARNDFWGRIDSAFDLIDRYKPVIYAMVGIGLCRGCLGWVLSLTKVSNFSSGIPLHYFVSGGEIVGFFLVALLMLKLSELRTHPLMLFGPSACIVVGAFMAFTSYVTNEVYAEVPFALGCVLVGFGYAVLLLLWLEFLGLLSPRNIVCSYALAYFINLAMWLVTPSVTGFLTVFLCITAALVSISFLLAAYRHIPKTSLPTHRFDTKGISWQLIVWVSVFSLAYGLGDSVTGMGFATFFSKFGMAVPALLVVVGIAFLPRYFEIDVFYKMTFVLMLFGLISAFFSEASLSFSQFMMSASNESFQLFAIAIACTLAHQKRVSSALYCGLLMGSTILCMKLGVFCGESFIQDDVALFFYAAALVVVVIAGTFMFRDKTLARQLRLERQSEPQEVVYENLADTKGLSPREKTVFLLLVRGMSIATISSELFIAQSTTRAHASRIYEKLGVHTRQEFDELIEDLSEKNQARNEGVPKILQIP